MNSLQGKAPDITDIWFCTSLPAKKSLKKNGKDRAERKSDDALKLKAIWIDCDVKANDNKHYGTDKEALTALLVAEQSWGFHHHDDRQVRRRLPYLLGKQDATAAP